MSGKPIQLVTQAFTYADGLAVDVDGGIYKGGGGFIYNALPIGSTTPASVNAHR